MTTLKDIQMSIMKDKIQMLEAKERKLYQIEMLLNSWKKHESYADDRLINDINYIVEDK